MKKKIKTHRNEQYASMQFKSEIWYQWSLCIDGGLFQNYPYPPHRYQYPQMLSVLCKMAHCLHIAHPISLHTLFIFLGILLKFLIFFTRKIVSFYLMGFNYFFKFIYSYVDILFEPFLLPAHSPFPGRICSALFCNFVEEKT
jgi:hypothetical protein